MDTLKSYEEKIIALMESFNLPSNEIESQIITDTRHHHYQITQVGWKNGRRIYGCVLHIDIKDDKVWIQHNGTEFSIGQELVEMGIPKNKIVMGFQSPFRRQYSGFAVA